MFVIAAALTSQSEFLEEVLGSVEKKPSQGKTKFDSDQHDPSIAQNSETLN